MARYSGRRRFTIKNWIIATLIALVAVGGTIAAFAQGGGSTARVEVTVWQRVSDGSLYLSTRPEGGRWTTHAEPLDMSGVSASGRFRQGSAVTVEVPVEAPPAEPGRTPSADSVSVSGVGPSDGEGPFVLPSGEWNCVTEFSGNGSNWAIIKIGGREPDSWIGYVHDVIKEITDEGQREFVFKVGDGNFGFGGAYHLDYVTYYEVNVAPAAEWSITCERTN